jgi:hypothetical protein
MMFRSVVLAATASVLAFTAAYAQPAPAVTRQDREQALDILARRLDHYVLREHAPAVKRRLAERRAAYLTLEDPQAFARAVTADLYGVTRDKHLQVWVEAPRPAAAASSGPPPSPEDAERALAYGLTSVRRLPGNVGYLKLRHFSGSPESRAAVDRTMAALADADALIIDVRDNGGGGEPVLRRLLGHLSAAPMELVAIDWRECAPPPADRPDACAQTGRRSERRWSETPEGGPTYARKPLYVLTSAGSFSAAEEFAYDLQQARRATVIGEITGGGANPSAMMDLGERFAVVMPIGVTRHPLSHGNWEGKGVTPDVAVPAAEALTEAYRRSLEQLVRAAPGSPVHGDRLGALADPAAALRRDAGL